MYEWVNVTCVDDVADGVGSQSVVERHHHHWVRVARQLRNDPLKVKKTEGFMSLPLLTGFGRLMFWDVLPQACSVQTPRWTDPYWADIPETTNQSPRAPPCWTPAGDTDDRSDPRRVSAAHTSLLYSPLCKTAMCRVDWAVWSRETVRHLLKNIRRQIRSEDHLKHAADTSQQT